jgi:hypothetical protein
MNVIELDCQIQSYHNNFCLPYSFRPPNMPQKRSQDSQDASG